MKFINKIFCYVFPHMLFCAALFGCHTKNPPNSISQDAKQLYDKAVSQLYSNNKSALEALEQIEQYYPNSSLMPDAYIIKAYAYYKDKKFTDSLLVIEDFMKLYPKHKYADYMAYLKGLCYYMQIVDIGRDQKTTYDAVIALRDVKNNFKGTEYEKDAIKKEEYAFNMLASKELDIGRFYLRKGNLIAAINRFKTVIDLYDDTVVLPEALYRLVESYYAIGIKIQAKEYFEVLKHNFPNSIWTSRAVELTNAKF